MLRVVAGLGCTVYGDGENIDTVQTEAFHALLRIIAIPWDPLKMTPSNEAKQILYLAYIGVAGACETIKHGMFTNYNVNNHT